VGLIFEGTDLLYLKFISQYDDNYGQKISDEWLKGTKKEAQVWKKVNGLIVELVHYSNGGVLK